MHIFSSPYAKATPEIVCLVFFLWSQSESLPNHLRCQWLCPGCAYPVEPPQARASARVLAKHVCQPKSCGCVVSVCCNWEIYIEIPLGWCGGAKEGLRYVNLGVWKSTGTLPGSHVAEKMCSPLFTHKGSFRKKPWAVEVVKSPLFVVISRRVGISPHPVAENHMFWALIVK